MRSFPSDRIVGMDIQVVGLNLGLLLRNMSAFLNCQPFGLMDISEDVGCELGLYCVGSF